MTITPCFPAPAIGSYCGDLPARRVRRNCDGEEQTVSDNPPGWYRDPADPTTQRYWDGDGWVGERLPVDATPPDGPLKTAPPAAEIGENGQDPASVRYPPANYPPGTYPPGSYPPNSYPPASYPAGFYPPGAVPPEANGTYPPGTSSPGAYPPGAYPPGAYPPGAYPPGAYPPGAYPPGAYPPGAYPPGAYPPGSYPPGAYPPGAYPPGAYPPGAYPPESYSPGPYPPGGYPPNGTAPGASSAPGAESASGTGAAPGAAGTVAPGSAPPTSPGGDPSAIQPTSTQPTSSQPTSTQPPGYPPTGFPPPGYPYRQGPYVMVPVPRPHGFDLAPLGRRLCARLIDFAAVLVLNLVLNGYLIYRFAREAGPYVRAADHAASTGGSAPSAGNLQTLGLAIVFFAMIIWAVYEVPSTGQTGQTLGKRLVNIRVMPLEGDHQLGGRRALRRFLPMGLPMLAWTCGIGFIIQFVDALSPTFNRPLRLALHDIYAATIVVAVPRSADLPAVEKSANGGSS
jgi:uncharacterized RDD family membrane protein YckC